MKRFGMKEAWRAAVAALLPVVLAACGASAGGSGGDSGRADASGVLKYGYPMPVAGLHFDPTRSVPVADVIWMSLVYGTLLRQSSDGTVQPWMAKDVTVVDSRTVKIALRPGIKFTDGSAYDAQAVKTSLMRARTPATAAARGGQDPAIKTLSSVDVVDPLTAVARLNQPLAGQFMTELSQRQGAILSPKQIAEHPDQIDARPVGAGPFVLEKSTPQQLLSFRKNPAFWDAANVKLGGVDIVNTPTGPQQANGLLAGDLDWSSYVSVDSVGRLKADQRYATQVSDVATVELVMCTAKAPFDNEAVRKAVQLGIDRDRFAQIAFGGLTGAATSFVRERSKNFDPSVKNEVNYDPEKAKKLIASTGSSSVSFDLHFPATLNFGGPAQVLQGQLQKIGVNASVISDRDSLNGFMVPQKPGALLNATIGSVGYSTFSWHFTAGSIGALCGQGRPDVMQAVNEAAALSPNDPKAIAAYQSAQKMVAEHAYAIPIVAYPTIAGWNTSRVGGTPKFDALGYPQFDSIYIRG